MVDNDFDFVHYSDCNFDKHTWLSRWYSSKKFSGSKKPTFQIIENIVEKCYQRVPKKPTKFRREILELNCIREMLNEFYFNIDYF